MNQIKAEEIALLLGMAQSLKDGDTSVEELMKPIRESKEAKAEKLNKAVAKAAEKKEESKEPSKPEGEAAPKPKSKSLW